MIAATPPNPTKPKTKTVRRLTYDIIGAVHFSDKGGSISAAITMYGLSLSQADDLGAHKAARKRVLHGGMPTLTPFEARKLRHKKGWALVRNRAGELVFSEVGKQYCWSDHREER
jgi:hypothetical protein